MEFDELVEHLDDLIARARSEGFDQVASAFAGARARVTGSRALFSRRVAAAVTSLAPQGGALGTRSTPDVSAPPVDERTP